MRPIDEAIVAAVSFNLESALALMNEVNMAKQQRASMLTQCAARTFARRRDVVSGVTRSYEDSHKAVCNFLAHDENLAHLVATDLEKNNPLSIALVLSVLCVVEARRTRAASNYLLLADALGRLRLADKKHASTWWRRVFMRKPDTDEQKAAFTRRMLLSVDEVVRDCYQMMHRTAYASLYAAMPNSMRVNFPSIDSFIKMYGAY